MLRLLANENFPGDAVERLRLRGHDVAWIRVESPGMPDEAVLARSMREQRILLTFDKDFGELVFKRGQSASCGAVLSRISTPNPDGATNRIVATLESRDDWMGTFSTVDDSRIRMVPLPPPASS